MPSPEVMPAFVAAVLAIVIMPGPDMAFIVASGVGAGPKAGVAAAFGMSAGMLMHTTLAALGLATLLEAVPAAMQMIRLLGAAYLTYLGVVTLRAAASSGLDPVPAPSRAVFRRAAITNLANPKIILFFSAFLPGFVSSKNGAVGTELAVLGLIFLLVGLVVDVVVGLSAGHLRRVLVRGTRLSVALNRLSGVILLTIAAILIVQAASR